MVFCAIIITRNNVTHIKEHGSIKSFLEMVKEGSISELGNSERQRGFLNNRVGMGILHEGDLCKKGWLFGKSNRGIV